MTFILLLKQLKLCLGLMDLIKLSIIVIDYKISPIENDFSFRGNLLL